MIKKFNQYINERLVHKIDDNIDGYVFYVRDFDDDKKIDIYRTLFKNGYKLGDTNDIKDLNNSNLNICFFLIMLDGKHIVYSSKMDIENDFYDIDRYLIGIHYNTYYNYYFIKNEQEFNNIFGVLSIKNYFDKKNVYESLLDKLEGPTEEEIDKNFNDFVKNNEEEKALNFAVKLKSIKYILKVIKEFGVGANEVLEKVINSSNYDPISFDNLLKSYDFIFYLDYEQIFELFNKSHSSFKEVLIKYIKDKSVLNGLLIDNAMNNNNGTVGIIIRNTKDLDYNEALVKACEYGSDDVIKMLLGATSADIHYKNNEALWYAIDNGKYSTIKILLENGANLYARNNQIIQTIKNYYSKTTRVYELLKSYDRKNLL